MTKPWTRPLWFRITLIDCNGMNLATWNYDEMFPVIPPRFTYINDDERCPYVIQFNHALTYQRLLPARISLNTAIDDAIRQFINELEVEERQEK